VPQHLSLAVFISGRGSNLGALISACRRDGFPARVSMVFSNRVDAVGLEIARNAGLPTEVVSHRDFPNRAAFDAEITRRLAGYKIDLICLAGFMRLLTPEFVQAWRDRLINIHPSLLPSFPGLDTHARALEAGVRITGCTVHFVRPGMDEGPIIIQAAVPVMEGDDEAALAARVLAAEHRIYPRAIELIASRALAIDGDRVRCGGHIDTPPALLHPWSETGS
jgi:phosphoribosylglycinamide formyltransferase-1